MRWLEKELAKADSDRYFIIIMHCFPGLFYFKGEIEAFWRDEYVSAFTEVLGNYHSKILLLLGAHTHFGDLHSPVRPFSPNHGPLLLISPSVSPIFENNPGYSILDLELSSSSSKPKITSLTWRFLDLSSSQTGDFFSVDPVRQLGVDLNDYRETLNGHMSERLLEDTEYFNRYQRMAGGYSQRLRHLPGEQLDLRRKTVCSRAHLEWEAYQRCYD